jgi:hypothetical protein
MSDNLRDRIAAVIYDHPNPLSKEQCQELADGLIRELGLRQEYDPYSEPESGTAMTTDQAYLDGFRDGIGAAVRALEAACHPAVCCAITGAAEDATTLEIVSGTLRGAANGLRMLSASVKLDDGTVDEDEDD